MRQSTQASFSLVNKVCIDILRKDLGDRIEGHWVEGVENIIPITGNIHPFSDYQVMIQPEADRTKSWMWLFTNDVVQSKREGKWGADRLYWNDELYEVMAVQQFSMGTRNHYEAKLARIELTPDQPKDLPSGLFSR